MPPVTINVAVRADGGDSTSYVEVAVRRKRVREPAVPRRLVDRSRVGCLPRDRVVCGRVRGESLEVGPDFGF